MAERNNNNKGLLVIYKEMSFPGTAWKHSLMGIVAVLLLPKYSHIFLLVLKLKETLLLWTHPSACWEKVVPLDRVESLPEDVFI